ncbi:MAG: sigma-70 family RNA polymerase sigma factor [Isosphaeraceae bacterium]|nr:sigma-70 family RNA polymerase sigma factor [Isosphaeraceae bacterium]
MRAIERDLRTLFSAGAGGGLSDGQLLEWFLTRQEDAAFAELVRRHGPMVMGVCRRALGNHHDAEDAFQATFLVLARNGQTVRPPERLAHWLHGVAWRITRKARATAGKRRAREKLVPEVPEPSAPAADVWDDLARVLDQELGRLPDRYRAPIVLCDLEGQGRKQAAQQLGWPEGTLNSRLSRARALLAQRLRRRGIALSSAALAGLMLEQGASAAPRAALVGSTVQTATLFAFGSAATARVASTRVLTLTERMLRAMLLSKLKVVTALLTVGIALLGAGAAGLAGQGGAKEGVHAAAKGQPRPPETVTVEGPGRFDLLAGDDGFGRLVFPAGKDHPAVELSFDKHGLTIRHPTENKNPNPQGWATPGQKELSTNVAVEKDFLHWLDLAKRLDAVHQKKGRDPSDWQAHNCQVCHALPENAVHEQKDVLPVHERNRIVRDVLVRQAVRDIEATLKRLEQDMPDRQTELEALDEIETVVRALKEKTKQGSH